MMGRILQARQSLDGETEQQVVQRLLASGRQGLDDAVRLLTTDQADRLKEAAAYLVGLHGGHDHAHLLLALIGHHNATLRRTAIDALQRMMHPAAIAPAVGSIYLGMPGPDRLPPDRQPWCKALRPLLDDPDPCLRARAAETLAWLDDHEAIPALHRLLEDDNDFVRYYGFEALRVLTGQHWGFMNLKAITRRRAPIVTAVKADGPAGAQMLSPFHHASHFISQGKYESPRGRPAQRATWARLWWRDRALHIEVLCEDVLGTDPSIDSLAVYLQPPGDPFALHRLIVTPADGLCEWTFTANYQLAQPRRLDEHAHVQVQRSTDRWTADLQLAFEAFDRASPPNGETWGFNMVRTEQHGEKPELSCWAHYYPVLADLPAIPRLGWVRFDKNTPLVQIRPDKMLMACASSAPSETGHSKSCCVRPDRLLPGDNLFSVRLRGAAANANYLFTFQAFNGDRVACSASQRIQGRDEEPQDVKLVLPTDLDIRALDLEVAVTDEQIGRDVFRACFLAVPLVVPLARTGRYGLEILEDDSALWQPRHSSRDDWVLCDHGPALMSEYYAVSLADGPDGLLYGGTFPGGRLFSYDTRRGLVRDLGSPCPPMNHTRNILVRRDGLVLGAVNRHLFTHDPQTGRSTDLGEPVPCEPYASMVLTAVTDDAAYGCHQGHLFQLDSESGRVTNKGTIKHGAESWCFHAVIVDAAGNLLAAVGPWGQTRWHLCRYQPQQDKLLLSDFEFEGSLFNDPHKNAYLVCNDGRLYEWSASEDRMILRARYALANMGRLRCAALRSTGELIVPRGKIRGGGKPNMGVLVFEPGGRQPIDLGSPLPAVPQYVQLTAITNTLDDTIYGLIGPAEVYGLPGRPVHIYSVACKNK